MMKDYLNDSVSVRLSANWNVKRHISVLVQEFVWVRTLKCFVELVQILQNISTFLWQRFRCVLMPEEAVLYWEQFVLWTVYCLTVSHLISAQIYFLCFKLRLNFQILHHFRFSLFLMTRRCFQFSLQFTNSAAES